MSLMKDSHHRFSLIIQPDDDWHYYLGSIPSSTWMHTFHSEWPESPSTLITFSPIQLLQKSISKSAFYN